MRDRRRAPWAMRTAAVGRSIFVAVALLGVLVGPATAAGVAAGVFASGLPNQVLTPGATNPAVTQATIHQTICVSGWTTTIRPSSTYTNSLKTRQIAAYGFSDRRLSSYEEDHLISLELGGSPRSPLNLWPEPHHILLANGTDVGSYTKDGLENALRRRVCAGTLSLASAQREEALNWVKYWRLSHSAGSLTSAAPVASPIPVASPAPVAGSVAAAKAAGASAVCNDHTWSYSANRSGTCSGHGGVYWWTGNLGPPGPG
jgi:hypothetical protein